MDKIFWPLLALGIAFLIFASGNYAEILFSLIFVILALAWFRMNDIIATREAFQKKLEEYFSVLESMITEKNELIPAQPTQPINAVTKEEMTDSMDRFAKKLIDIENKLNQLKKTLAAAFSALDERIKAVEEETFPNEEI